MWIPESSPASVSPCSGYGSQGRAHALNLKDSGHDVVVGLRRGGPTWDQARTDGCEVVSPVDAVASAELVAVLVPDMAQPALYRDIESKLRQGDRLCCSPTASTSTTARSSPEPTSTSC